ncbi:MAG: apolipoprotein N-acyltransferase [Verrucomicrobiales bacterium]|jgi:apolipoprotein N-acyltransferase
MFEDWQSWAALVIVGITLAAFVWRAVRKRRKQKTGGCSGCG